MCFHTRTPDMVSRGAYSTGICPVEQGFVTLNEEIRTIFVEIRWIEGCGICQTGTILIITAESTYYFYGFLHIQGTSD